MWREKIRTAWRVTEKKIQTCSYLTSTAFDWVWNFVVTYSAWQIIKKKIYIHNVQYTYCFVFNFNYIITRRHMRYVAMSCLTHNQWHRLRIRMPRSYAITDFSSCNLRKWKRAIIIFKIYCLHPRILNFVCGQNMNASINCVRNAVWWSATAEYCDGLKLWRCVWPIDLTNTK